MTDAVSYQQMGTAAQGQALMTGGKRILASERTEDTAAGYFSTKID